MSYSLKINGQEVEVDAAPETPLLWVLRDHLGMIGTKYGCGIAQCGACTVHVDGQALRSCNIPVDAVADAEIRTIEGLSPEGDHPLQQVWAEANVPQCGYCQTGIVMAAAALLERNPDPSDEEINLHVDNICRCGTYPRVRDAIHRAAEIMRT